MYLLEYWRSSPLNGSTCPSRTSTSRSRYSLYPSTNRLRPGNTRSNAWTTLVTVTPPCCISEVRAHQGRGEKPRRSETLRGCGTRILQERNLICRNFIQDQSSLVASVILLRCNFARVNFFAPGNILDCRLASQPSSYLDTNELLLHQ